MGDRSGAGSLIFPANGAACFTLPVCPGDPPLVSRHGQWFDETLSPNASPVERARMLRRKLETHVIHMAGESEELGDAAETLRLRTESIGVLIALRELWLHFPEAFQQPPK